MDRKIKRSIVTKRGDEGYSYVYSGAKLRKDDLRFEAVGTIDELSSFLGLAKSLIKKKNGKDILERIQRNLFVLGSEISALDSKKTKSKFNSNYIRYLEKRIEALERGIIFKDFVLVGDNLISSILHITRTIARRLERRVVALKSAEGFKNKNILIYLNRLSDLMFLLAYKYSFKKR